MVHTAPDSATEFLVVSDTCAVEWVPHITGNQIPSRAVVGGRNADGGLLFVATLWTTNVAKKRKILYGYHDPELQLGFVLNSKAASNSSVNIMVKNQDIEYKCK